AALVVGFLDDRYAIIGELDAENGLLALRIDGTTDRFEIHRGRAGFRVAHDVTVKAVKRLAAVFLPVTVVRPFRNFTGGRGHGAFFIGRAEGDIDHVGRIPDMNDLLFQPG